MIASGVSAAEVMRFSRVNCPSAMYAGTCVATMAEVTVDKRTGRVQVKRVLCAQDQGVTVSPDGSRSETVACGFRDHALSDLIGKPLPFDRFDVLVHAGTPAPPLLPLLQRMCRGPVIAVGVDPGELARILSGHPGYEATGGTVTRVLSQSFGALEDRPDEVEVEIRASWTPLGDIADHVEAWGELLCTASGLPPVPEGVAPLPSRRGQRGRS